MLVPYAKFIIRLFHNSTKTISFKSIELKLIVFVDVIVHLLCSIKNVKYKKEKTLEKNTAGQYNNQACIYNN